MSKIKLFKTLMAGAALVNLWFYLDAQTDIVWGLCAGVLVWHLIVEALGADK